MTLNTRRAERTMQYIGLAVVLVLLGLAGHRIDRNQQEYRQAVTEYIVEHPAR